MFYPPETFPKLTLHTSDIIRGPLLKKKKETTSCVIKQYRLTAGPNSPPGTRG